MSFEKVTYTDNETVIHAAQLNAIQNELIRVAGLIDALEDGDEVSY